MKIKAVLKPNTIRLTPYVPGLEATILNWYDKKENAEFFRRCPPSCDWLTPQGIQSVFGNLWVIYEHDKPIGLAGLFSKDPYSRSCEAGLMIDNDSTENRAQAATAVYNQVCTYVFDYLNFHKIYVKMMPWRAQLAKRAEEHGFTQECELRDSCFFRGEYHNELLYSCLKLEFKEVI